MKIIKQMKDDAIVELTAEDLRFTVASHEFKVALDEGMNINKVVFGGVVGDDIILLWGAIDGAYLYGITDTVFALLSDWRKYTARRLFEMMPEVMFITRRKWFGMKPILYTLGWTLPGRCVLCEKHESRIVAKHNLPDLWPGQPDNVAIISREEVMG